MDTLQVVRFLYDIRPGHRTLKNCLQTQGLQARQLHNAGSDSLFTLKSLLVAFCHWKYAKSQYEVGTGTTDEDERSGLLWECQLVVIGRVAHGWQGKPRPPRRVRLGRLDHPDILEAESNEEGVMTLFD